VKKKIAVAVVHALQEPWIEIFENGSMQTWLKDEVPSDMDIFHFHGSPLRAFGKQYDRIHEKLRWFNRYIAVIPKVLDFLVGVLFIFFIPGVSSSNQIMKLDNVYHIHVVDSYQFLRWKDLAIFKYLLETLMLTISISLQIIHMCDLLSYRSM